MRLEILRTYLQNRTLKVFLNGNMINSIELEREKEASLNLKLLLKKGLNRIEFLTNCDIPYENRDERCISIAFRELIIN